MTNIATDKSTQFLQKLNSLPEEAQLYFGSADEGRALKEISLDYNIPAYLLDEIVRDVFVADFNWQIIKDWAAKNKTDLMQQKKLAADILGKIFLPVDEYLERGAAKELPALGRSVSDYQGYIENCHDLVVEENLKSIEDLSKFNEADFDIPEEERAANILLGSQLNTILHDTDIDGLTILNHSLIYLFDHKPEAKAKILKTFSSNQEAITTAAFMVDGKSQKPTVANWLQDFITINGSEIFDTLILSKYLTSSTNAKLLSQSEKKIVDRLLRMYRNLAFYPDSLAGLAVDKWEIVPLERPEVITEAAKAATLNLNSKTLIIEAPVKNLTAKIPAEAPTKVLNPKVSGTAVASKMATTIATAMTEATAATAAAIPEAARTVDPAIDLQIKKMRDLLLQYPVNSLEAKAILEELKNLQNKIR